MSGSFRLGKILGIDIRIHYSWFLIFAFVSYYVYGDFRDASYSLTTSLLMGVAASMALFMCIVAHELAHSVVAIRNGIPVRSITLFILGGVASITKEAERPRTEALMAIAGPSCSLVLGLVVGAGWLATGGYRDDATAFHGLLFWLATVNLALGVFNLLPGFPMDGGRVLRATIWGITKDFRRATRIASIAGQIVGWSIASAGVGIIIAFLVFERGPFDLFDGIYFALLGWFLSSLAASSYREAVWRETMQGITAVSAMVSDFMTIPPGTSLTQLVRDYIQPGRYRSFVVAADGSFMGIVDVENIRRVPQTRWDTTTADSVMTPASKAITATPEEEGISLAAKMDEYRLDGIPVVKDGAVIGIVTRPSLGRVMQMRAQFGAR